MIDSGTINEHLFSVIATTGARFATTPVASVTFGAKIRNHG